jgi:hypothetical protein
MLALKQPTFEFGISEGRYPILRAANAKRVRMSRLVDTVEPAPVGREGIVNDFKKTTKIRATGVKLKQQMLPVV